VARSHTEDQSGTGTRPTGLPCLYRRRVADAIARVSGALYEPPNAIVMHPRRWAWLLTQNEPPPDRH
jgi:hypothetical protein